MNRNHRVPPAGLEGTLCDPSTSPIRYLYFCWVCRHLIRRMLWDILECWCAICIWIGATRGRIHLGRQFCRRRRVTIRPFGLHLQIEKQFVSRLLVNSLTAWNVYLFNGPDYVSVPNTVFVFVFRFSQGNFLFQKMKEINRIPFLSEWSTPTESSKTFCRLVKYLKNHDILLWQRFQEVPAGILDEDEISFTFGRKIFFQKENRTRLKRALIDGKLDTIKSHSTWRSPARPGASFLALETYGGWIGTTRPYKLILVSRVSLVVCVTNPPLDSPGVSAHVTIRNEAPQFPSENIRRQRQL